MNRSDFFKSLAFALAAMKAGKVENILPEAPIAPVLESSLPGVGMQSFSVWVGPKAFNLHDILVYNWGPELQPTQFYVSHRNQNGDLVARALEPIIDSRTGKEVQLEIELLESEDLWGYSKKVAKLCSAIPENS